MATPPPRITEPDPSALICAGDQVRPCCACHRKTHRYGRGGARSVSGAWQRRRQSGARTCTTPALAEHDGTHAALPRSSRTLGKFCPVHCV